MTNRDIINLIKEAHRYAVPDRPHVTEAIDAGSTLSELGIESVSAMEMAGFIEDRLNIEFPDDDMATIGSIDALIALIRKHRAR